MLATSVEAVFGDMVMVTLIFLYCLPVTPTIHTPGQQPRHGFTFLPTTTEFLVEGPFPYTETYEERSSKDVLKFRVGNVMFQNTFTFYNRFFTFCSCFINKAKDYQDN